MLGYRRFPIAPQRKIMRTATLEWLDTAVHLVRLEPVQGTLDRVEVATQTDLVCSAWKGRGVDCCCMWLKD